MSIFLKKYKIYINKLQPWDLRWIVRKGVIFYGQMATSKYNYSEIIRRK